jgi:2'-5' RNA ligase
MPRLRTFVAVELAPSVTARAGLLIDKLRVAAAQVNWARTQQMHLTLKFLGDVPDIETPDICRVVTEAARGFEPFEITCRGVGAFPTNEHPRTLWIGIEDGAEELCALQTAIELALKEKLGFPKEARRFQPHLTIGRVKHEPESAKGELTELLKRHEHFDADLSVIDEVVVFASFLHRSGPDHEAIGRAELGSK